MPLDLGPKADVEVYAFTMMNVLSPKVGPYRVYMENACSVVSVRASVGTAPTGAAILVDINKNGSTIFTTQGDRPTIAVGTNTDTATPNVLAFAAGDYLTVDVDQVGSTVAGADLTVVVRMRRTA